MSTDGGNSPTPEQPEILSETDKTQQNQISINLSNDQDSQISKEDSDESFEELKINTGHLRMKHLPYRWQHQVKEPEVDIMNAEDFDTDLESEDEIEERIYRATPVDEDVGTYYYKKACTDLEITPLTRILENLTESALDLRYQGIGAEGAKALADALLNNTKVEYLNLEENGLEGEGGAVIADMLRDNIFITQVNLARNDIGTMGAIAIGDMLPVNTGMTHLNLSENKFRDTDAEYIAAGLERNERVVYLDLSKNGFCEDGAQHIGNAIGINNSVEYLNLSWNCIRRKGAVTLAKGLKRNYCLTSLDLSFNGLGYEGALAMANCLKSNKYLRELDFSNNRINWDGADFIAKALKENNTLEVLKIGHNPLTMTGCQNILEAIYNDRSELEYVGFDGVPINRRILYLAESINRFREFAISHGGVSESEDVFGKRLKSKEDPLKLLLRFLSERGIRVMDLFRTFDKDKDQKVSREQFITGLKKVQVPLADWEIHQVMEKLDEANEGRISYQKLNTGMKMQKIQNKTDEEKEKRRKKKDREHKAKLMNPNNPPASSTVSGVNTPRTGTSLSFRSASRRSSLKGSTSVLNRSFSLRGSFANLVDQASKGSLPSTRRASVAASTLSTARKSSAVVGLPRIDQFATMETNT